jgi:hemerythrin-like domain-containing protein
MRACAVQIGDPMADTALVIESKLVDVTTYLSWDHDRLDAILADVARMVDDGELERAEHVFTDFADGLDRHIRLEEDTVFRIFEERTGLTEGPTRVMRAEHVEIRHVLSAIRGALGRGDGAAFRRERARLENVLGPHNVKEERVLYPSLDRLLSPGERPELAQRLAAYV